MKPVTKKATPAAIAMLRQATALAPKRSKVSDGPENGVDCADIFEKLKEDKRVKYLIFNKKIWSKDKARSGNRLYTGSNPHTKHLHVSINSGHGDDTSPWFWWMNQPKLRNQLKAAVSVLPEKKVIKEDTSKCCQHCPKK